MDKCCSVLLGTLCALVLVCLSQTQPAVAASAGPAHLEFYMYVAVQNNSNVNATNVTYTAVQSAQPASTQNNSFGIIHTFDNPITSEADLNSTLLGSAQGWYGDVGQDVLTLFLVQTFTWSNGSYNGTFSLLGTDVATDEVKYAPIIGGTRDFAYARGVAELTLVSTADVDEQTVSWFRFVIHFLY